MSLLTALFLIALTLLAIPVLVLSTQIAAALPAYRRAPLVAGERPSVAVLVPAHNEAAGIAASLQSIGAQLRDGDRLLVIADNCSDDTAQVARTAGAEVLERSDDARRGKGYALDYGVRHLGASPPPVVIVVDADCLLQTGALDRLAHACARRDRPVQALYVMQARTDAAPVTRVAQFAWMVKNWLRPLGYARLGMPCQLMGTGMAFPWRLIEHAPLANASIVEDLKLGLDCAAAGRAPVFCPEALVTSVFPENREGGRAQRTRWEHGHLGVMLQLGPRLLLRSLRARDGALFALVIDLCVPPLSLLMLLVMGVGAWGAALWWFTGSALPWALACLPPLILLAALWAAWLKTGRTILPLNQLAYVLIYVITKIPMYITFLVRRQVVWISSARDKSS